MEVHPNFKKGYDNMMKLSKTKKFKKAYGHAVGKAKAKALKKVKKDERPLTGTGHKFYESIEHDFTK